MGYKEEMNIILAKAPDILTQEEITFLIERVGYLSDEERARFKSVLKRSRLTKEQLERYQERRMQVLLDLYFPVEGDK